MDLRPIVARTTRARGALVMAALAVVGCSAASGPGETAAAPPSAPPSAPPATASTSSVWDGVYTAAQADQGEGLARANCFGCHAPPEWAGLLRGWSGQTVRDLYQFIFTTMPADDPGSLSRAEYAAVLSYILELNGAAAGSAPLPSDNAGLSRVQIVPR